MCGNNLMKNPRTKYEKKEIYTALPLNVSIA